MPIACVRHAHALSGHYASPDRHLLPMMQRGDRGRRPTAPPEGAFPRASHHGVAIQPPTASATSDDKGGRRLDIPVCVSRHPMPLAARKSIRQTSTTTRSKAKPPAALPRARRSLDRDTQVWGITSWADRMLCRTEESAGPDIAAGLSVRNRQHR